MSDEVLAGGQSVSSGGEPQGSGGGDIDQADYVDDAAKEFEKWFAGDNGKNPKAESESKVNGASPDKPEETKAETPKGQLSEKPQDKVAGPDRFETAFTKDGAIDVESMMSLALDDIEFKSVDDQQGQVEQEEQEPVEQTDEEYLQTLSEPILGPLEEAFNAIQGGKDPLEALNEIYLKAKAELDGHVQGRVRDRELSGVKKQSEVEIERLRSERYSATAADNVQRIAAKLPGATPKERYELFYHIVMGNGAGGDLMTEALLREHPKIGKMAPEQQAKVKKSFVDKYFSNPAKLKSHFDIAMRYHMASPNVMKKAFERIGRNAESLARSNGVAAQTAPGGAGRAEQSSNDGFDAWLSPSPRRTRVG